MNKYFVPTPQDETLRLQGAVTKTATFKSAGLDLGQGFAPGGLGMAVAGVVNVTAADRADSDETYSFKLQESDDDVDANYVDIGVAAAIDVSGATATTGAFSCGGLLSRRWVRLVMTAAGTTPSITYESWLNPIAAA